MIEIPKCRGNLESVGDKKNPSKTDMVIDEGHKPHHFPREVVTLDDPQTSLWIKVKGWVGLYGCEGKETRCSLASNTYITR